MSKPQISYSNKYDRIIALIDMDCFYCQVEEKLNPELKGKSIAVVQYNAWRGGGIIAVNYPARAKGVTRHMRGEEAKQQCPDIELARVPNVRGKADLSKYREAGKEVAAVLQTFTPLLERASVDEAYLDITQNVQDRLLEMNEGKYALAPENLTNTFALGYDSIATYIHDISEIMTQNEDESEQFHDIPEEDRKAYKKSDLKLLIGASIVSEIREAVKEKTGYECSAGIAHNKVLAKLVCGMNKPNKQSILSLRHLRTLYEKLPVKKVQGLGGKFGEKLCEDFGIKTMAELGNVNRDELQKRYDDRNGLWLYYIARGIDLEAVTPRLQSKSIGCCKKFPGRNAITGIATLKHWLHELAKEIVERLEQDELENNRRPKQMVVSFMQMINNNEVSSSRAVNLTAFDEERLVNEALETIKKNTEKFFKSPDNMHILNNAIKFLGLSVGKFESQDNKPVNTIQEMFKKSSESRKEKSKSPEPESLNNECNSAEDTVEVPETTISDEDKYKNSFFAKYLLNNDKPHSVEVTNEEESLDHNDTLDNQLLIEELKENQQNHNKSRSISPQPSTSMSKPQSYTETYAEFQRPQAIEINIPKVECTQCNKMVKETDLQTHTDGHMAFQLSQEQRLEFRKQIKTTPSVAKSAPPAKKPKHAGKNQTDSSAAGSTVSLHKFLVKKENIESVASTSAESPGRLAEDEEICSECGKKIRIADVAEHMDYHTAKRLQMELNQMETKTTTKRVLSSNSVTKKDNVKSNKKNVNNNSTKSVASFFQNS